jgi:hypothetical protein
MRVHHASAAREQLLVRDDFVDEPELLGAHCASRCSPPA